MPLTNNISKHITSKVIERIRSQKHLKVYALAKRSVVCSVRAKITRIEENREKGETKIYFKTPEITFHGVKNHGVEIRVTLEEKEEGNPFDDWYFMTYEGWQDEVTLEEEEHYLKFG